MLPTNDYTTSLSHYHKLAYKLYFNYDSYNCTDNVHVHVQNVSVRSHQALG